MTARAFAAPRVTAGDVLYEYLQLTKPSKCHVVSVVVVNPTEPTLFAHVLQGITNSEFVNGTQ